MYVKCKCHVIFTRPWQMLIQYTECQKVGANFEPERNLCIQSAKSAKCIVTIKQSYYFANPNVSCFHWSSCVHMRTQWQYWWWYKSTNKKLSETENWIRIIEAVSFSSGRVGRISVAGGECPSVLNRNSRGTKKMGKHWAQPAASPWHSRGNVQLEAQRRTS